MKTSDADQLDMNVLANAITSVIGGEVKLYDMNEGFLLKRDFMSERNLHFIEIKKEFDKNDKPYYTILSYEKEKIGDNIFNIIKLNDLQNLYVTIPNLILGEKRKITFLTLQKDRFMVIDFTDKTGFSVLAGKDRREKEDRKTPSEKRRKFIKL